MTSGFGRVIPTADMGTHLIAVGYNPYSHTLKAGNKVKKDSFGHESIGVENRQLNDDVKHASGYDPNINANFSRPSKKDLIDRQNASAIIQAIPRKIRGPGADSTTLSPPYEYIANVLPTTGEPTTTIVYATSIPKAYVDIRPIKAFPRQKNRLARFNDTQEQSGTNGSSKQIFDNQKESSTLKQQRNHLDIGLEKPDALKNILKIIDGQKDSPPLEQQKTQLNIVLKKPVAYKNTFNLEQAPTSTATHDSASLHSEQRKSPFHKSLPNVGIQNDNIIKMSTYNGNTLPYSYQNHKWSNEDFLTRLPPQFLYNKKQENLQSFYRTSPTHDSLLQRYSEADEYHDETYASIEHPTLNYAPQLPISRQHRTYQPLTIRDFQRLLQLLVLRESQNNYNVDPHKLLYIYPSANSNPNFINPLMYLDRFSNNCDNSMLTAQKFNKQLLPPNVREELLYRMLLLALHMQSSPKPMAMPQIYPILSRQYTYHGPSDDKHSGFQQYSDSYTKGPVRSVQILGEID